MFDIDVKIFGKGKDKRNNKFYDMIDQPVYVAAIQSNFF